VNCLLLEPGELDARGRARLEGRRLEHARKVLGAHAGDALRAGVVGGPLGRAEVLSIDAHALELHFSAEREPPAKLPVTLVLALPRPKVLSRTLAAVTSLGVARIELVNAWRVEKAYWQSDRLGPEHLAAAITDGLEQAVDTVAPELTFERLFVPFCSERLPGLVAGATGLVAHPRAEKALVPISGPVLLAVGPEGGFIDAELGSLERAGLARVSLGPRVLRVETAVAALVGRLSPG
jgi:16S rRNA (uracil1498-N3)-methyltransferase